MTEIGAFLEVMRMIERNMDARRATAAAGGAPRSDRRLRALIRAATCMVEISGCRYPEEAIFAQCRDEVQRLHEIRSAVFPDGLP